MADLRTAMMAASVAASGPKSKTSIAVDNDGKHPRNAGAKHKKGKIPASFLKGKTKTVVSVPAKKGKTGGTMSPNPFDGVSAGGGY